MTVDTLLAQNENDYSQTIRIVDKSSRNVWNNVNLVKHDISNDLDVISNLESVVNFNKSLNKLTKILNKLHLFNHEFHCAMSIGDMSQFILTDDNFSSDYFDFLLDSVDHFINLIEFKLNNLSEINSASFKKEYTKLSREFLQIEKFFYTEIYNHSRSHDREFFEDMVRLLAR